MKVKQNIKKIVPSTIWEWLHRKRDSYSKKKQLLAYQHHYNAVINRLKSKKEPLNVLFMAIYGSNWKYDSVYQLMLNDPMFNPIILVCPDVDRGREHMIETMNNCCRTFEKKGYPYVRTYDEKKDIYVDAYFYQPDIIFYTNPYDWLIDSRYYLDKFPSSLTCYVNYFYVTINERWACAERFHKVLWRYYVEYELLDKQIHQLVASDNISSRVTGYPLFDSFRTYSLTDNDWPIIGKRRKRIIWAPHHTISGNTGMIALSTFEKYFDFMLNIAEKFKDEIDIVFKPHPLLKPHLYEAEDWRKERTDAYYEKWATGENTAFVDGEYVGLFLASDAMIHDCNSFTVEYLAVNKPAMFLDSGKTDDKLNEAGKEARACYYKGYSEEDIEHFILQIVLGGKDDLKEKREAFYKNFILPPNGKLAAENIIDDIVQSIWNKK